MSEEFASVPSAAWQPPAMSGPVISFRHKQPDASEVEHEAHRATREGFARGHADGLAAAASEMAGLRQRLQQQCATMERLLQQMARPFERLDAGATQELVHLASKIGAALATKELHAHPTQILEIARSAIDALPGAAREVRLLLNPLDFALLSEGGSLAVNGLGWQLLADSKVARGGCRVLLETSEIDAQLEARLAALGEQLFADAAPLPRGDVSAELAAERGEKL